MAHQAPHSNSTQKMEKLTPEEEAYFRSCMRTKAWTTCIPAAVGTSYLWWHLQVKIRGKPTVLSSCLMAGVCGAVVARFFSFTDCVAKLTKKYPDGTVATMLREKGEFPPGTRLSDFASEPREPEPSSETVPYVQAPNFLDLDTNIPDQKGLPESGFLQNDDPTSKGPVMNQSYDDLRRKNREQFIQRSSQPRRPTVEDPSLSNPLLTPSSSYYDPPTPPTSTYIDTPLSGSVYMDTSPSTFGDSMTFERSPNTTAEEPKKPRRKRVNKYGDEIEE